MPQGGSVEFLGVSGTISVGPARAMYDFTWVIYHMHIDEISWVIFSTLDNALVDEFSEDFWETINFRRKDRWGFFEVPWIDDREAYDVAPPYTAMQLPIFDSDGHTTRLANPFIWNHNYVKVHPNGALIYAEDKKLAFFLPYMVETYNLLPTKPLLWVQDNKTFPSIERRFGCMKVQSNTLPRQVIHSRRSCMMKSLRAWQGTSLPRGHSHRNHPRHLNPKRGGRSEPMPNQKSRQQGTPLRRHRRRHSLRPSKSVMQRELMRNCKRRWSCLRSKR